MADLTPEETIAILTANRTGQLGPYLSGLVAQQLLMGILLTQCFHYFHMFPKDSWLWNKSLVLFLLVSGVWQAACSFEMLWSVFVSGYGDILDYNHTHATWWLSPASTALVACASQSFFLTRCWRVTRNWLVLILGGTGILVSTTAGITVTSSVFKVVLFTRHTEPIVKIPVYVWLVASSLTDVGISTFLIIHLRKSSTGFNSTDSVIRSLLKVTLETCGLTTVIVLLDFIIYATTGDQHIAHFAFQFIMGKVYAHSVLYTLNARINMRAILARTSGVAQSGSGDRSPSANRTFGMFRKTTPADTYNLSQIQVRTQVDQHIDGGRPSEEDKDGSRAPPPAFERTKQISLVTSHTLAADGGSVESFEDRDASSTSELRREQRRAAAV